MAYDVAKLLTLSQADLDALFTTSPVGELPDGEADGTAIVAPGTVFSSSSHGLPDLSTMKSTRPQPLAPTRRNASSAMARSFFSCAAGRPEGQWYCVSSAMYLA